MKTSFLQRAYLAFCWLLVIGGIVLFSFKALNGNFAAENDEMFRSFEKMEQQEKAPISDLYRFQLVADTQGIISVKKQLPPGYVPAGKASCGAESCQTITVGNGSAKQYFFDCPYTGGLCFFPMQQVSCEAEWDPTYTPM